jgi:hypothetical protein
MRKTNVYKVLSVLRILDKPESINVILKNFKELHGEDIPRPTLQTTLSTLRGMTQLVRFRRGNDAFYGLTGDDSVDVLFRDYTRSYKEIYSTYTFKGRGKVQPPYQKPPEEKPEPPLPSPQKELRPISGLIEKEIARLFPANAKVKVEVELEVTVKISKIVWPEN